MGFFVPLVSAAFRIYATATKPFLMNRLRILGLFLWLLLPWNAKSETPGTSLPPISRTWGFALGTANNAYDFLIYDATCSQNEKPALFIVGKAENSHNIQLKQDGNAYFHAKDDYTDAFLACMSLEGDLLWSTYLPALEEGYYNAFASAVEYTSDSTLIVVGNAYAILKDLDSTRNRIPNCPGKLFILELDVNGNLLNQKTLETKFEAINLSPPLIKKIVDKANEPTGQHLLEGFGGGFFTTQDSDEPAKYVYSYPFLYLLSTWEKEDPLNRPFLWNANEFYFHRYLSFYMSASNYWNCIGRCLFDEEEDPFLHFQSVHMETEDLIPTKSDSFADTTYHLSGRGIDLFQPSGISEAWHSSSSHNEHHAYPTGTYNRTGLAIYPGTVQNVHAYNGMFLVQGIHCRDYDNGFFRKDGAPYAYSHDTTHLIPRPEHGFYQKRDTVSTAVPYLLLYDSAGFFGTIAVNENNLYDYQNPIGGTYLNADWFYEDIFHVTDSAQIKDLYQPYEPVVCSHGNAFFLIGNAKNIDFNLIDNPTMTEEVHHHLGVVLAFSSGGCPPENTAFQNVRFLCPDDSVELKLSSGYKDFKFRFDSAFLADGSIVLNADSTRAWAKKEGMFTATLNGGYLGCPDVRVDTVRISFSPYPEPVSAMPHDTTVACAATGTVLMPVETPDSSFSYRWFDGDSAAPKTVAFAGDSAFFAIVETSGYCTSFRDSSFIRFLPPYVNLGADTLICQTYAHTPSENDTLLVLSAAQDYFPAADWLFRWQINGKTAGNENTLVLCNKDLMETEHKQKHALIVVQVSLSDTSLNACTASDSLSVFWIGADTATNQFLPIDTLLCAHLDLSIQLPEAADNFICNWLDMDSIVLPGGRDTTRFTVSGLRGTDGFGQGADARSPRLFQLSLQHRYCSDWRLFDTLAVFDILKPAVTLPTHDTLLCRGVPVDIEVFEPHVYKDFYSYLWSDGNDSASRQFADSGYFTLLFSIRDSLNVCGYGPASDTLHILAPDPALTDINLPGDTVFCSKLAITLNAAVPYPSTRYSWQEGNIDELIPPSAGDSAQFDTPPFLKIEKDGDYVVFLLDSAGCLNAHQIMVVEDECIPLVEIPNVFTPNGDGVNDVLKFKQLEKCFEVDILIVNRQGNTVLHKKVNDLDGFSWNGCLNNGSKKLPDGPYFYLVSYKNAYGKKKVQSGSITILGSRD